MPLNRHPNHFLKFKIPDNLNLSGIFIVFSKYVNDKLCLNLKETFTLQVFLFLVAFDMRFNSFITV